MEAINPLYMHTNLSRAKRWHNGDINEWSLMEWLCAAAGELGEACNAAKKLKRIEDGIANYNFDVERHIIDKEVGRSKVLEELADTFAYLTLAAQRLGATAEEFNEAIRVKFNMVSEQYGFPEGI
jgi:NTP pyrophosphatase (non-canonical NTP hydrolase)